jgi:hypothetical protein
LISSGAIEGDGLCVWRTHHSISIDDIPA